MAIDKVPLKWYHNKNTNREDVCVNVRNRLQQKVC